MAQISWSLFLNSITGKVDGFISQKWKETSYIRKRWKVDKRKRSDVQKANCASFGNLSTLWKHVPEDSKETWKRYARKANRSGYNAFLGENHRRRIAGEPFIMEAPEGSLPRKKKQR